MISETGPVEPDKEEVRSEPYSLSDKFTWDEIDLTNEAQITELYDLLNENYVEDDDNMFRYGVVVATIIGWCNDYVIVMYRFDYSKPFLRWALQPPGWKRVWHCGVRVRSNKKLVGFISAVPAYIRIKDQYVDHIISGCGLILINASSI